MEDQGCGLARREYRIGYGRPVSGRIGCETIIEEGYPRCQDRWQINEDLKYLTADHPFKAKAPDADLMPTMTYCSLLQPTLTTIADEFDRAKRYEGKSSENFAVTCIR